MDWNNDGKKDLIVGESYNQGRVRIYLNVGTDANPSFNSYTFLQVGGLDFTCLNQAMPEIVDWNNDGKKDVLCGHVNGPVYLLLNVGTDASPQFAGSSFVQSAGANLNEGSRSSPVVVDWNRDGKKDLLVGEYSGRVHYFENIGTDASPVFNGSSLLRADGNTIDAGNYSRPEVCDWDRDGMADLLVGSADGTVSLFLSINPDFPSITFEGYLLNDSAGNTNCAIDALETIQLIVSLSNSQYRAENVVGVLSCDSPYVSFTYSTASFGTIPNDACVRNSRQPFCFLTTISAPADEIYSFTLDVSYDGCMATSRYEFTVGDYACDDTAGYSWIDTAGQTVLPIGDESYIGVGLGFSFPFYGNTWNTIQVTDNGYLMFGSPVTSYENEPIPSPGAPNAIVAPFWIDMDPGTGGVVRCGWFGSAPNRYCVVEWNQVPLWMAGGSYTFEAILYENGMIKFQYNTMSGVAADGSYAAVGIENEAGDRGVQYSFNEPGSISPGLAIEFYMGGGSPDTDGDALPDWFEEFYFGNLGNSGADDDDGDGMITAEEIRCGTDPTDASSCLSISDVSGVGSDGIALEWQSIRGKRYNVESCTNLLCGVWTAENALPLDAGSNATSVYTASVSYVEGVITSYRITLP